MSTKKTKPITKIDRPECRLLSEEIISLLRPLAEKYGLELDRKGATFNTSSMTLPVVLSVGSLASEKIADEFERYAHMVGADPSWFNHRFLDHKGKGLTIVGLNLKAPKNCIQLEDDDGRTFKCSVAYVKDNL